MYTLSEVVLSLGCLCQNMSCNITFPNSCGVNGVCHYSNYTGRDSCFCFPGFELKDGACRQPPVPMAYSVVASFCWLCFLLILGKLMRLYCWCFQKLYLPASVIGGVTGLVLIQLLGLNTAVSEFVKANFTRGW